MKTNNSVMAEVAQNWWATTPDGPLPVASTCTCPPCSSSHLNRIGTLALGKAFQKGLLNQPVPIIPLVQQNLFTTKILISYSNY